MGNSLSLTSLYNIRNRVWGDTVRVGSGGSGRMSSVTLGQGHHVSFENQMSSDHFHTENYCIF